MSNIGSTRSTNPRLTKLVMMQAAVPSADSTSAVPGGGGAAAAAAQMVSPFAMVGVGAGGYTHEPFIGAITFLKTDRERERERLRQEGEGEKGEEGGEGGEELWEGAKHGTASGDEFQKRKTSQQLGLRTQLPFLDSDGVSYVDVWFAWSKCVVFPPNHPRVDKLLCKAELALRKSWFEYFGLAGSEDGRKLMLLPQEAALRDPGEWALIIEHVVSINRL
jgi:hypothetical protein